VFATNRQLDAKSSLSRALANVGFWQIVLKSLLADDGNVLEPLMRFARRDVRTILVHTKTTTDLRIRATENRNVGDDQLPRDFGVARFSTFATESAHFARRGPGA
jgi:hypothetical protein